MQRMLVSLVAVLALTIPVMTLQVFAQEANEAAQIAVIEPPFQSPQQWKYDPNDLSVGVGATVVWTNTGAVTHTVNSDDGNSFNSGSLDPNEAFSFVAQTPGIFTYHCAYHPWMTGTLTVSP